MSSLSKSEQLRLAKAMLRLIANGEALLEPGYETHILWVSERAPHRTLKDKEIWVLYKAYLYDQAQRAHSNPQLSRYRLPAAWKRALK